MKFFASKTGKKNRLRVQRIKYTFLGVFITGFLAFPRLILCNSSKRIIGGTVTTVVESLTRKVEESVDDE